MPEKATDIAQSKTTMISDHGDDEYDADGSSDGGDDDDDSYMTIW